MRGVARLAFGNADIARAEGAHDSAKVVLGAMDIFCLDLITHETENQVRVAHGSSDDREGQTISSAGSSSPHRWTSASRPFPTYLGAYQASDWGHDTVYKAPNLSSHAIIEKMATHRSSASRAADDARLALGFSFPRRARASRWLK